MTYWKTLAKVVLHVAKETGKVVTEDDILGMAEQGHIQIGARIPTWENVGVGELQWYRPDGSQVNPAAVSNSDGVVPMDVVKLGLLVVHGMAKLAGLRWKPGEIELTAGPDSPAITKDDLRIHETEFPRILAVLSGETPPEREVVETGEHGPYHVDIDYDPAPFNQWQEIAASIARLRDAEANMPPLEQEAAIRLRERHESELRQLVATPEYRASLTGAIAHMKRNHEAIVSSGDKARIEQSEARVKSWEAHLARIGGGAQAMDGDGLGTPEKLGQAGLRLVKSNTAA